MANMLKAQSIRDKALEFGFEGCGIVPVSELSGYGEKLKERRDAFPGVSDPVIDTLDRYADMRTYPWARAVIVCTSAYGNYSVPEDLKGRIGRYYLFDHKLQPQTRVYKSVEAFEGYVRERGIRIEKELHGVTSGRWAAMKAGLGIIRKNNFLFTKSGSRVIIDTWVIDKALECREEHSFPPCPEGCGRCFKACPTGALRAPYCMDLSRCVTKLTWGQKGLPPEDMREPMGRWIYGCDECQDACPYNAKLKDGQDEYPGLNELSEELPLENIVRMSYEELTALLAAKFWIVRPEAIWKWKVNALRAMANGYKEEYGVSILAAGNDDNENVRAMAQWAAKKADII